MEQVKIKVKKPVERECPKCGKGISDLVNWSRTWEKYWFDGEDYICGGDSHPDDGSDGNEYCCPDCGEVLFRDEDEARKFLKGEMIYYFIEHNGRKLNAFYPNDIATNPFSFSTRCWVSFDTVGEAREYIDFIKRELNTKEHPDFKKYLSVAEKFQIRQGEIHP